MIRSHGPLDKRCVIIAEVLIRKLVIVGVSITSLSEEVSQSLVIYAGGYSLRSGPSTSKYGTIADNAGTVPNIAHEKTRPARVPSINAHGRKFLNTGKWKPRFWRSPATCPE